MSTSPRDAARRAGLLVAIMAIVSLAMMTDGTATATFEELTKLAPADAQTEDRFGEAVAVSGDTAVAGVGDRDAAYVFQRDGGGTDAWGQVAKLSASDGVPGDFFGASVSVSGDTILVGAWSTDAGSVNAGAAYVFRRSEGGADTWDEVAKLTAADGEHGDWFGHSVAIDGDTAVVGAFREGESDAGAAYVFERDAGGANAWGQVAKLSGPGTWFGFAVAASGDTVVVGTHLADPGGGFAAGAAYVFERDEGGLGSWGEVKKLTASDADAGDEFGYRVAISADTAVIGAHFDDAAGCNAGAAYIFERHQGGTDNWGEVTKLTAADAEPGDLFGVSVAVTEGVVIVGADGEDTGGNNAGAAYLFERDRGGLDSWSEAKALRASDAQENDTFGHSVAVSGETAVVGAHGEDSLGEDAGAAYVFVSPSDLTGDATCDGVVNAVDATFVLQFAAALLDSLPCHDAADASGDGLVNAVDATLVLQFVAGLLDRLPP